MTAEITRINRLLTMNFTKQATDVLIIGAGPSGLTLAVALAQLGISIRIIDKAPQPKGEPRAAIIWQRAQEQLGMLGVTQKLLPLGNTLSAMDVYGDGKRMGEIRVGNMESPYPHPLIVEQHVTERILNERLQELGATVEWGLAATEIQLLDDRAVVTTDKFGGCKDTIMASWVVGCEGSNSLVRKAAGIAFRGRRRRNLQVLQINASAKWRYPRQPERGMYFLKPGVTLGCFPLADTGAWRFFAYTTDPDPTRTEPPTLDEMQAVIADVACAPELRLTPTEPHWLRRARFQDRVASTLRHGRALLVGDAAHVWAPIGGHGMNTGMRGACNLAWKLAAVIKGEAADSLLDTYSVEQRAMAKTIIRETRLDLVEHLHSRAGLSAMEFALPALLNYEPLQHWMDNTLSDTQLRHAESALTGPGSLKTPRSKFRTGDRFPPLELARLLEGQLAHESASGAYGSWLVIAASPDDGDDNSAVEGLRALAANYSAPIQIATAPRTGERAIGSTDLGGRVIVLRPDGYIGMIAGAGDLEGVRSYFDQYLVRAAAA